MPRSASPGTAYSRPHSGRKPRPAVSTKLTFHGSVGAFQDLVLLTGVYGEWQENPNGVWRYLCEDRAGLNWSSTRGTVWCDGPPKPRARLERTMAAALRQKATGPRRSCGS
jgi:hypothetical protein